MVGGAIPPMGGGALGVGDKVATNDKWREQFISSCQHNSIRVFQIVLKGRGNLRRSYFDHWRINLWWGKSSEGDFFRCGEWASFRLVGGTLPYPPSRKTGFSIALWFSANTAVFPTSVKNIWSCNPLKSHMGGLSQFILEAYGRLSRKKQISLILVP